MVNPSLLDSLLTKLKNTSATAGSELEHNTSKLDGHVFQSLYDPHVFVEMPRMEFQKPNV
jgi:hypothetical protein